MFRKINENGGFTNQALEVDPEDTNSSSLSDAFPVINNISVITEKSSEKTIQISRPHYDQNKLHDELNYNKPIKDSGKWTIMISSLRSTCIHVWNDDSDYARNYLMFILKHFFSFHVWFTVFITCYYQKNGKKPAMMSLIAQKIVCLNLNNAPFDC